VIILLLTCAAILIATPPLSLVAHKCGAFVPVPPLTGIFHLSAKMAARLRLNMWINFIVFIHRMWSQRLLHSAFSLFVMN
jgi:hypothetical protein